MREYEYVYLPLSSRFLPEITYISRNNSIKNKVISFFYQDISFYEDIFTKILLLVSKVS